MENFEENLKELKIIERLMLSAYGPKGKTILIQSCNKNSSINSFTMSKDGFNILNSMQFSDNHLLKLILNSVKSHSNINGDNSKTFFVYILTGLLALTRNKNSSIDFNQIQCYLRFTSVEKLLSNLFTEFDANYLNQSTDDIKTFSLNEILNDLCVTNDVSKSNKLFKDLGISLCVDFVQNYIENTEYSQIPDNLKTIFDDLDNCLIHSDKNLMGASRVLSNGFLIDRKYSLNNLRDKPIRAIFIENNPSNERTSNEFLSINSSLSETLYDSIFYRKKTFFSETFIEALSNKNINLIFLSGSFNELQMAQLNSAEISLISFIDKNLFDFICFKLGKFYINFQRDEDMDENNIEKNSLKIESYEKIENEDLYFFKVRKDLIFSKLAFVYFTCPIKFLFNQFKCYIMKVVKTLLNLFDNSYGKYLIKYSQFETISQKIIQKLEKETLEINERFFYKFMDSFFKSLIQKFKRQENLCLKNVPNILQTKIPSNNFNYEPLSLKVKCLIQSLSIIQSILKIENIYYINKQIKDYETNSDNDEE